jgi:hypothetical protein
MDPQVIGADERQVVILYHQRGVSPSGERFDGEVVGLYNLRDFKLARKCFTSMKRRALGFLNAPLGN